MQDWPEGHMLPQKPQFMRSCWTRMHSVPCEPPQFLVPSGQPPSEVGGKLPPGEGEGEDDGEGDGSGERSGEGEGEGDGETSGVGDGDCGGVAGDAEGPPEGASLPPLLPW